MSKLIHRPEEALNIQSEWRVVSALTPGMKCLLTNKREKVMLNKKTKHCIIVFTNTGVQ